HQFPPYVLSCAAIGGRRRLNRAHGVILSARRYAGKSVGPLAVNIHPSRVVPASRKPALHRTLVCPKNYRTHGSEETISLRNFELKPGTRLQRWYVRIRFGCSRPSCSSLPRDWVVTTAMPICSASRTASYRSS